LAIETTGAALRQINRLLDDGSVTGFADTLLLERFVSGHDAAAFEVLVARHGPMVLSVCRGILKDPNDAEDAFQATFLILVKKRGTFRGHVALGPWLYQVAHRVAIRANAATARRRACERQAGQMAAATSTAGPSVPDEQLQALHEEIARLPEKLSRALILCDLQRVPQARAAGELRLSERTLQRRLSEGRKRLKDRLIRRGLAQEREMLGTLFLREALAAVPATWGEATVQAALASVNGGMTVGIISAAAKELTREVLKTMLLTKLPLVSATLLGAGLVTWRGSAALLSLRESPVQQPAASPDSRSRRTAETAVPQPGRNPLDPLGNIPFRGRVLGPDGMPVLGARLYLTVAHGYAREPFPTTEHATTGADGRFLFTVPTAKLGDQKTVLAATAASHGVGWVDVPAGVKRDDLTLRLANDDVPITGQVVDLEGKPVPGATFHVLEISAAAGEHLSPLFEAPPTEKGINLQLEKQDFQWDSIDLSRLGLKVTTDAEGRFRLTGLGQNRRIRARLDGPAIASQYLQVLTRNGMALEVKEYKGQPVVSTFYGASFRYVAAPTKPVVGVVRDKDTGKPLAGATIESNALAGNPVPGINIVQTTTDVAGRFRLLGMPKGKGNKIRLVPPDDQPYLSVHSLVPDTPGLDPVTVDFELKRGIWIEGRLTDKMTGKPVHGSLNYFAMEHNPNVRDHAGFNGTIPPYWGVNTNEDGSYRVVGLPGPGLIAVFYTGSHLLAPDRDDEYGTSERFLATSPTQLGLLINYPEKSLVGVARPPTENGGAVTVQMQPGATIIGRLVEADGKPRVGVELRLEFRHKERPLYFDWSDYSSRSIKTDREGRFRIEALLPGYEFRLQDDEGELQFLAPDEGQTGTLPVVKMGQRVTR